MASARKRRRLHASSVPPSTSSKSFSSTSTSHEILRSYTPAQFTPHLSSNPHFQTILPHFYPPAPPLSYTRTTIPSDDGAATLQLDLAFMRTLSPDDSPYHPEQPVPCLDVLAESKARLRKKDHVHNASPVAVVLHGLESNADATVTRRIVAALGDQRFRVAVLNFRTCASGVDDVPSTLRLYHAGFTEDLETLLRAITHSALVANHHPPDVYLCGFSLGANVACQFLGRHGESVRTHYGVVAAAAACVPFDPVACQRRLDGGWRGFVYSSRLVGSMQSKFKKAMEKGVDVGECVPEMVQKADRVGLIDEAFITPVFGFRDRMDYYQQVDSRKVLKRIVVPTYLINARDDPFFDHASGQSLPTPQQIGDAPVLLNVTDHGGHCGFLDKEAFKHKGPCYFQREFARFFAHVREEGATTGSRAGAASNGKEQGQTRPEQM